MKYTVIVRDTEHNGPYPKFTFFQLTVAEGVELMSRVATYLENNPAKELAKIEIGELGDHEPLPE